MSQKIRYIKYIVLTSLVHFLATSCSFRPDQLWMKTNEDVRLWVSSSDTTKSFYGKVMRLTAFLTGLASYLYYRLLFSVAILLILL